jgi:hypothetical protein
LNINLSGSDISVLDEISLDNLEDIEINKGALEKL